MANICFDADMRIYEFHVRSLSGRGIDRACEGKIAVFFHLAATPPAAACTLGDGAANGIKNERKNKGNAMQEIVEQMTQIMTKMMPYMWYIADVGIAFLVFGAARLADLACYRPGYMAFAAFRPAAHGPRRILCGLPGCWIASWNEAVAEPWRHSKGEFVALPFWMIGLPFYRHRHFHAHFRIVPPDALT